MDEQEKQRFSWARLEFAGVTAFAVMFGCLFIGQTAEQFADRIAPSDEVAKAKPQFNAIDYAATGAARPATVVIGPCHDAGR